MSYIFQKDGYKPDRRIGEIFVYGSNLGGFHGAGAAREAYQKYGALWGVGIGFHGNSYGIPTKTATFDVIPLDQIKMYVDNFLDCARKNMHLKFYVTRVGCGLAGYGDDEIAPMFNGAPENCSFAENWKEWLT